MATFLMVLLIYLSTVQTLNYKHLGCCPRTNNYTVCLNDWARTDLPCNPHLPWQTQRRLKRSIQCTNIACQNGGFCKNDQCVCLKHHLGQYCSKEINYCINNPCKHKSKCLPRIGGFTCECPPHLAGKLCQLPVQQMTYNMKRPNFIYIPNQHAGFKYDYLFHAEDLGVLPDAEIDFGDGTLTKNHGSVTIRNALTSLMKYFPPPWNVQSNKIEAYFFAHIYTQPKIYTITVKAWNQYQEVYNTQYEVRVNPILECSLDVNLLNADEMNLNRQHSVNIMSTVWSNCTDLNLHYRWEIFKDTTKKGIDEIDLEHSNLVIPPFTLDYGSYTINLHVEMVKPKSGIKRKVTTWLRVIQRPIIAHIQGGGEVFVHYNARFYLDAGMSYDPNYGSNRQPLLIFKWMCIPRSDFCKGMRPIGGNGSILIVPADSLSEEKYTFKVLVNSYEETECKKECTGVAEQIILKPAENIPLLFRVFCLHNCIGGLANNMYTVALKAINLVEVADRHNTSTSWLVYPRPDSDINSVLNLNNTEFTESNTLMILSGEQLESGVNYKFVYSGFIKNVNGTLESRYRTVADFYLTTHTAPGNGICTVSPTQGYAMITRFSLECDDFANSTKTLLIYEVIQFLNLEDRENSGAFIAYDYSNTIRSMTLSPGIRRNDYITTLRITATNNNGVSTFFETSVTVFPLIYYLKDPNGVLEYLTHIGSGINSPLNLLCSSGNHFELIQQICSACFSLEDFLESKDALYLDKAYNTMDFVAKIQDHLTIYLYQAPISTIQSIKHVVTALDKVMKLPSKIEMWTRHLGITIMKNLIQKLADRFEKYDENVFQNDMDEIGTLLLSITAKILKAPSHVIKESELELESDTSDLIGVIERFMQLYMIYKIPNERATLFTNSKLSIVIKKGNPEHLTARSLTLANSISLSPRFYKSLAGKRAHFNLAMIVMKENPNLDQNEDAKTDFPYVKINLTNSVDGSPIDADMVVYMRPFQTQPSTIYNGSLPIRLFWQIKEKHIRVHRIIVPKGAKLVIQFLPIPKKHRLRVVIKKEMRPRMVDFWVNGINIPQYVTKKARDKGLSIFVDDVATSDNTFFYLGILPHIDTLKSLMSDVEEPVLPYAFHYDEDVIDKEDLPDYYPNLESATENSNIQALKHRVFETLYNNRTLPYAFAAHTVRCVTSASSNHSCDVKATTSAYRVVCNCTGLAPVTVRFQNAPVRYQKYIRTIYRFEYADNPLIPFVVLFSLILFLGLFKWAVDEDRKDRLRRTVCVLVDNYPQCEYCYLIIVYTGLHIKSGTTSNVTIELEGTYATSLPHVLNDWKHSVMDRGSKEWFLLKTMKPLGEIFCLHIWTDYSGAKPSWFCKKVIVQDVQEQQVWFFMVNRWFDPINADGTMSYTIYQSTQKQIFATSYQVRESIFREFESGMHGWLSILFKHPYSNFTRKQRVAVAYAHMMVIMMILIYLRELPVADSPSHQMYKTGSYQFEVRDLLDAFYALLLALPLHAILIVWFRCVRPSAQWTAARVEQGYARFNIQSEEVLWINPEVGEADIRTTQRPKPKRKQVSFFSDFYEPEGERTLRSKWSLHQLEKKAGDKSVVPLRAPTSKLETETNHEVWTGSTEDISGIYGQEVIAHSFCFPPYCVFIGWTLVFMVVVPCVYITAVYGISYGWVMGLHYLTRFAFAIILSILLVEPIKLCVCALCVYFFHRREYAVEDRSDMIDALNTEYHVPENLKNTVVDKINSLRKKPMYMPLSEEAVHKHQRNRVSSFLLRIIIADFMCLILFLLLFFTMIYNVVDSTAFLHKQEVGRLFNAHMKGVSSQGDLVEYLKITLIPNIYQDDPAAPQTPFLTPVVDEVNFLLGVIRLRQIRKTPETCQRKLKPRWKTHCTMNFDSKNYSEGWKSPQASNRTEPWLYQYPKRVFGKVLLHYNETYYPTGSYNAFLGRTKETSLQRLEYLIKNAWFDDLTTVVYIDFVLYNLNTRQLALTTLMAERTLQGSYYIDSDIQVIKMPPPQALAQLYVLFYLLPVLIWMVLFVHKESTKYSLIQPKQVFSNKWSGMKKYISILGIINVMLYSRKIIMHEYRVEKMSEAHLEKYLDFKVLPFWEGLLLFFIALMQFLVILEVCDLFKTCYCVNLALTTVQKSKIAGFFVFFILIIICFAWAGYLLFGRFSYDFRNFKIGFLSVVLFASKGFHFGQLGEVYSFSMTFLYYFGIVVIIFFVFRWLIAAIMIHYFSATKRFAHFKPYHPVLSNYTKKYFDSIDCSPNRKPLKRSIYLQSIEPRMNAIGHFFVDFYYKGGFKGQREMAMDAIAFGVVRKKNKREKEIVLNNNRENQARALTRSIINNNVLKNKFEYLSARIDIRIREARYRNMEKMLKIVQSPDVSHRAEE